MSYNMVCALWTADIAISLVSRMHTTTNILGMRDVLKKFDNRNSEDAGEVKVWKGKKKITYFLPAAITWVNKSEFTGIPNNPICLVKWEFMERWVKMAISSAAFVGLNWVLGDGPEAAVPKQVSSCGDMLGLE